MSVQRNQIRRLLMRAKFQAIARSRDAAGIPRQVMTELILDEQERSLHNLAVRLRERFPGFEYPAPKHCPRRLSA